MLRLHLRLKSVGKGCRAPLNVEIKVPAKIVFGNNVAVGPQCTLGGYGGIELQNFVRISKRAHIESATLNLEGAFPYKHIGAPIVIKNGVWIGASALILGGVSIGEYAVIGAGAIISKDVPDRAIVVGSNHKIVGYVPKN